MPARTDGGSVISARSERFGRASASRLWETMHDGQPCFLRIVERQPQQASRLLYRKRDKMFDASRTNDHLVLTRIETG
jgi:hypothetical protein